MQALVHCMDQKCNPRALVAGSKKKNKQTSQSPCINYVQYEQGCAVRIRHIFSASKEVQYGRVTSSVQARMYSTNEEHFQYKRGCAGQRSRSLSFGTGVHCLKILSIE